MQRKKLLFIVVFLFSFLWMLSLTYNFNFFWEDSYIIGQYNIYRNDPEAYTPLKLIALFVDTLVAPEQFYGISYGWKPMQEQFIYQFIASTLGINILVLRVSKALLFAGLVTLWFWFLAPLFSVSEKRISLFHAPFVMVVLLWLYLLFIPESWLMTLYFEDTLLLTLFFATLPLALFYFCYNNDKIQNKYVLSLLFFIMVLFTELSILTKHVGRINFLLILVFLFFTERKKILTIRYGLLILVLFSLSFPIVGFFKVFTGVPLVDILGISTHTGIESTTGGITSLLFTFVKTFPQAFLPHAFFLLLLLVITLLLHIAALCLRKQPSSDPYTFTMRSLSIFSFWWFLFTSFASFIARGFIFDNMFFLRFEFMLFIFPQALFIISYALFIFKKYYSLQKIFLCLILIFLLFAVLQNIQRLNEWRGGWGAYFLGYDTARQYVDEHAQNAVLFVELTHASPTYFVPPSTNQHIMTGDIMNSTLLRSYAKNYSTVYVTQRYPLTFSDPSIVNVANLTIIDNSLYGRIKKLIGRYYVPKMYIYKTEIQAEVEEP